MCTSRSVKLWMRDFYGIRRTGRGFQPFPSVSSLEGGVDRGTGIA